MYFMQFPLKWLVKQRTPSTIRVFLFQGLHLKKKHYPTYLIKNVLNKEGEDKFYDCYALKGKAHFSYDFTYKISLYIICSFKVI